MDQQPKVEARVDRSCLHPRGKYTVYRVVIQRQSSCGSDEIILFKRFSDFLRLRHHLNAVHKALGYREPLPQLLNGKYFDRFQPSVIETRRQALDGLIKFIASNDHLYCHTHFTLFAAGGLSVDLTSNQGLSFLPLDNKSSKSQEIRPTPSLNVQSPKQLPLKPPKVRKATASEHFTSPLSSDTESDLEGDSLLLVWECNASQSTNIAESIQAAKNSTLKGRWIDALRLYKDAISGLTTELKSELNGADKKEEYRCLLAACLAKAEFIHGEYLSRPAPQCTNEENQSCHTWMKSPKLASLCQDPVLLTSFGSTDELRKLKICEVEEQGLVVCDRLDSLVRYSLKSRCAPSTLNGSFPQIRSATLNGPAADCILPVGSVPFMCRLRRLIETEDRIFFLTERTKGELLLVDWLNTYLERRVASLMSTAKHRGLNSAMRHLSWCKRVSIRVRHMTLIHLQEFIDDSASPRCMSDAISQGSNSRIRCCSLTFLPKIFQLLRFYCLSTTDCVSS
uniref:Protein kinase domain-containing protein n=1 Tax=Mesocestoides corti TaxID=53468 RepID=A0A5K3FE97_MESCO